VLTRAVVVLVAILSVFRGGQDARQPVLDAVRGLPAMRTLLDLADATRPKDADEPDHKAATADLDFLLAGLRARCIGST